MNCCGRQRVAVAGGAPLGVNAGETVRVSYAGVRTIVVKGAVTGRVYRFTPGASVRVHGADALYMREIPGLRVLA